MAKTPKELANPITGQPPNSFTQVTNRELGTPHPGVKATPMPAADQRRMQKLHKAATSPDSGNAGALGYRRPEGMDPAAFTWLVGGHRMFPNTHEGPAINEPHEATPGVTVQRRAEDLSGPEYRKGEETLTHYGMPKRNPVGALEAVQSQALDRVMGEHAAAGVEESSSQMFYGGKPVSTRIPDPVLQKTHETEVTRGHDRFMEGVSKIVNHPEFKASTENLNEDQRQQAGVNLMAQSVADTSPQNKYRSPGTGKWPNVEQAEESAIAGIEGREAVYKTGLPPNHLKAAARVKESLYSGTPGTVHQYGDLQTSAKTVAFRGAEASPNSPDAFKVSDVHEGGNSFPGLPISKSLAYKDDAAGKRVMHHADQPASHVAGMTPEFKGTAPVTGSSRVEDMLKESKGVFHSLNDYATRRALAARGLSRGENYADNVHASQATTWGSQQVRRSDVDVSHSDQYPVVRDWGAEGHADLTPMGQSLFGGPKESMGPQFRENPNIVRRDKTGANRNDVSRNKPYPIMPGE